MKKNKYIPLIIDYFKPFKLELFIISVSLIFYAFYYLFIPILRKNLIDNGFIKLDINYIFIVVIIIFLLDIMNNLIEYLKERMRIKIAIGIEERLYSQFLEAVLNSNCKNFKAENQSKLINDLNIDIENIIKICNNDVFFAITQALMLIGGGIGLFIINWKLAIFVVITIPIKYFIVTKLSTLRKSATNKYLESMSSLSSSYSDIIGGIRDIKIFNLKSKKEKDISLKIEDLVKNKSKTSILDSILSISDTFILNIIEAIIYIVSATFIVDSEITLGGIFAFVTYTYQVMEPISALMNIKYIFNGILPSIERYHNSIKEYKNNIDYFGDIKINSIDSILFKNIDFSYKNGNKIFNNLNFMINRQDKIVISGNNGVGKSTLIRLLIGIEKPTSGTIFVNNTSINHLDIEMYRDKILLADSESYIFNDTLENNTTLNYNISKNYINILDELNKKFKDSFLGINGSLLSSGERQRIILSRAFILDKDLYIFDEATSNLDILSKNILLNLIKSTLKNKTVIVIAHTDFYNNYANKIITLKNDQTYNITTNIATS